MAGGGRGVAYQARSFGWKHILQGAPQEFFWDQKRILGVSPLTVQHCTVDTQPQEQIRERLIESRIRHPPAQLTIPDNTAHSYFTPRAAEKSTGTTNFA